MPLTPKDIAKARVNAGDRLRIARREERVREMLLLGLQSREIRRKLAAEFDCSERSIGLVMKRVREEIMREEFPDRDKAKKQAIARLRRHISRAEGKGDENAIARFEAQLAMIEGTNAPTRHEFTFDEALFSESGLERVSKGEDPEQVLKTGGAAASSDG